MLADVTVAEIQLLGRRGRQKTNREAKFIKKPLWMASAVHRGILFQVIAAWFLLAPLGAELV